MLIRIMYKNGEFEMVKPYLLSQLLWENRVQTFKRSEGWVVVGKDPLRRDAKALSYNRPERRAA